MSPRLSWCRCSNAEPGTGFGVELGGEWAVPGLIASLRKARLCTWQRQLDVQALTDVNTMLFQLTKEIGSK